MLALIPFWNIESRRITLFVFILIRFIQLYSIDSKIIRSYLNSKWMKYVRLYQRFILDMTSLQDILVQTSRTSTYTKDKLILSLIVLSKIKMIE